MKVAPAGGSLWGIEMGMAFRRNGVEPAPGACTREGAGQSAAGIWRRKKKKQGTWPDGKPEHNKCRKERKK